MAGPAKLGGRRLRQVLAAFFAGLASGFTGFGASISRARSRSSGVSTPSGTVSTSVTSMRMPDSRARNCSSFSRISNVDGGSETKRSNALRR